MAIRTNLNYRFKRSADQEERMKYLVHDLKLFRSYSQILMVSAVIGYNNDAFCPITASASDTVQMTTFQEKDRDVIDFIAFAYKKEIRQGQQSACRGYGKRIRYRHAGRGGSYA